MPGMSAYQLALHLTYLSLVGFVRRIASWAITTFIGDSIFGKLMLHSRKKTVAEYYKYTDLKNNYTRNWNQEVSFRWLSSLVLYSFGVMAGMG